ncbi:beta-ribofuranosylaminobenzene 5'-phosphate synthase family protein [Tundrisphaera lichenicola]|uniref:beta-ribofuranosylaminobenzene 5'-phosphate synthase family protein n=1 Tax=Tundrisphaera lichenicola TaxID=2029860 RepID=UPI003EB7FB1A
MTRFRLRTPSRLHFGLLSWGANPPRQFGGAGLMIEAPGLELSAETSRHWQADGPMAGRVLAVASKVADQLASEGSEIEPASFNVLRAPSEHVGLGVGTQIGLGVARLLIERAGRPTPTVDELARLTGRGLRSGIGLHGFALGGLIVDGGRRGPVGIPPLLSRVEIDPDWSVLVVIPPRETGLHGPGEVQAFADLPPSSDALTDRLCRLVLLGLLPAAIERDLLRFGEALEELQRRVGQGFSPAQGGIFARPEAESIAGVLRTEGLHGVGQSSWGPTLYGLTDASPDHRTDILGRILRRTGLPPASAFWTSASVRGATLDTETSMS